MMCRQGIAAWRFSVGRDSVQADEKRLSQKVKAFCIADGKRNFRFSREGGNPLKELRLNRFPPSGLLKKPFSTMSSPGLLSIPYGFFLMFRRSLVIMYLVEH